MIRPPNQSSPADPSSQPLTRKGVGCVFLLVQFLSMVWISGNVLIMNFITWSIEQIKFYSGRPLIDPRWGISLFAGLLLFMPLLVASLVARDSRLKRQFILWCSVSLFVIFFAPLKLFDLTQFQTILASQVGIFSFALVILLVVRGIIKDRNDLPGWSFNAVPTALLLAGVLAIPWVLWGAWGSALDLVLGVLVGMLAGWFMAILLDLVQFRHQPQKIGSNLFAATLANVLLVGALGMNGNQWVLLGSVLFAGWVCAELYAMQPAQSARSNVPTVAIFFSFTLIYPLVFLDPDELQAVTAAGEGDLFQWVRLIILISVIMMIVAGIIARIINRNSWHQRLAGRSGQFASLAGWLVILMLFIFFGQPGFHGERLFVILADQADLSEAAQMDDYPSRKEFVFRELVSHAQASQAQIRTTLDRFGLEYTPYYLVNAIEVRGGPLVRLWLAGRPEVSRILNSPYLRPLPQELPVASGELSQMTSTPWNLRMINADDVWQMGVRGAGIVIGQSDSGVQGDHPELSDSYLGRDGDHDYRWYDPWNGSASPVDFGGHGTHTLGTVLGNKTGVAPDADWIGCVNLARNLGNPAYYLDCMQFMLAPFPQGGDPFRDGNPGLGADVLNNSWGCPVVEGCDPASLQPAVIALRAAGIFVVASAGNNGENGCGTVEDPIAIYEEVFSVGAIDQSGNLTSFSSLGPVEVDDSMRLKPDIVAPGGDVPSAFPGSSYAILSGTSMAGPHLAGVVALMWSANPDLIGNVELTEALLVQSVQPYKGSIPECVQAGDVRNAHGAGIVDALGAVERAWRSASKHLRFARSNL